MSIAVLFSGQGAQFPGMNEGLSREVFDIADRVLGRSIFELCKNGSEEELNLTHNTQPCVLAVDLATYYARKLKPDAVAGFSLGEYAALVAAGVLDIEDAFKIVQIRADAMQDAVPIGKGAMAAVMKIDADEVQALCDEVDGYVIAANFNSPKQTVVSGEIQAVDKLLLLAKERKIRAAKLPVSAPFHCKMMEPAALKLKELFATIDFKDADIPVYMNVDGLPETDAQKIKEKLILQAMSPLKWVDTLNNMYSAGIDCFVECGPGHTLTGFVKRTLESVRIIDEYSEC